MPVIGGSGCWQLALFGLGIVCMAEFYGQIIPMLVMAEENGDAAVVGAVVVMLGIGMVMAAIAVIAAIVVWIIWVVRKGDEGQDKYGPDPRAAISQQPYMF